MSDVTIELKKGEIETVLGVEEFRISPDVQKDSVFVLERSEPGDAETKRPTRFFYRNKLTSRLISFTLYDFNAFFFDKKCFKDYFQAEAGKKAYMVQEFTVKSTHNIGRDGKRTRFTAADKAGDSGDSLKYRYPLFAYDGWPVYKALRKEVKDNNATMPADAANVCADTKLKDSFVGRQYRELELSAKLVVYK